MIKNIFWNAHQQRVRTHRRLSARQVHAAQSSVHIRRLVVDE